MPAHDYTVRLHAFQGPLDLLLQLIKRAELDITEIALASITDQYLEHIATLDSVDMDEAADFLLLAATLIEIKSRLLDPESENANAHATATTDDTADPAEELIQQLLAYRAFREAGNALEQRRDAWSARFGSARAHADRDALHAALGGEDALDLDELNLYDLVAAFNRIVETVELNRVGDHEIETDDTPIELHAADILDQLQRHQRNTTTTRDPASTAIPLARIFNGRRNAEIIGLFLAILELVKERRIRVLPGTNFATNGTDVRLLHNHETNQHTNQHANQQTDQPNDTPDPSPTTTNHTQSPTPD